MTAGLEERQIRAHGLGLRTYEGALSFVTTIFPLIGILHINENAGGRMTEVPCLSRPPRALDGLRDLRDREVAHVVSLDLGLGRNVGSIIEVPNMLASLV